MKSLMAHATVLCLRAGPEDTTVLQPETGSALLNLLPNLLSRSGTKKGRRTCAQAGIAQ